MTDLENSKNYEPENSSSPQNFILRCPKCKWARITSGLERDLSDLTQVKASCKRCGKFRTYKCPTCGMSCSLKRFRGNN